MTTYRDNFPDDLAALWQSEAPTIDTTAVMAAINDERRQQRSFVTVCYIFAFASLAFTIWVEFQGLFRVPGIATALVVASIVWQYLKVRHDRTKCPDVATLAPPELVRLALRHACATLKTARVFYAVMPLSLVLGFALGPIFAAPNGEATGPAWVLWTFLVPFLIGIAGCMVWGVRTAKTKVAEIAELHRRLNALEAQS